MRKTKIGRIMVAAMMMLSGVFALAGGVLGRGVWAEDKGQSSAIAVSPMNSRIVLIPGESYSDSIRVSNPADSTKAAKFSVHVGSYEKTSDAETEGDAWTADTGNLQSYNEMVKWITLKTTEGEVKPNEAVDVAYTINVPEDAPAGGQYATIVVSNDTEKDGGSGNVMISEKPQIASIIYAEVTGETKTEGKVLDNSVPSFLLSGPLEATSVVENEGNVHADASYTLQVWPIFSNEELCTNEEKPSTTQIMPQSKQLHTESCKLGTAGIFKAKQTVTIFGDTSIVEKVVVLCPIWLMIVILLIIVAIIGAIVFIVVRNNRKTRGV